MIHYKYFSCPIDQSLDCARPSKNKYLGWPFLFECFCKLKDQDLLNLVDPWAEPENSHIEHTGRDT